MARSVEIFPPFDLPCRAQIALPAPRDITPTWSTTALAHILITGASSGLGEYLALELARRGHVLGLVARRGDKLAEVAEAIARVGGRAAWSVADVTDREALRRAIAELEVANGPTDILVANAGSGTPSPAARIDAERVLSIMRLNYDGVVYAIEAVLPGMLARGAGQIVAVSSLAAWLGLPQNGAYSASKAAVSRLMEAYSGELRPLGIAVTTIHPGFVRTPLTAKNRFKMPFLQEPESAARVMADGILARRRTVDFPVAMRWLVRVASWLPAPLFERAVQRALPSTRPEAQTRG
jgi:short-subunit dehydrogenase